MVVISRLAEQPLISRLVSLKQQFRMQTGRREPIYNNVREYINIFNSLCASLSHRCSLRLADARNSRTNCCPLSCMRCSCAGHYHLLYWLFARNLYKSTKWILLVLHNIKSHRMHDKKTANISSTVVPWSRAAFHMQSILIDSSSTLLIHNSFADLLKLMTTPFLPHSIRVAACALAHNTHILICARQLR